MHVRIIEENDYQSCNICPSFTVPVSPQGITAITRNKYSKNCTNLISININ